MTNFKTPFRFQCKLVDSNVFVTDFIDQNTQKPIDTIAIVRRKRYGNRNFNK